MEVQALEAVVIAIPPDCPEKAEALNELGKCLWQTALQTQSEDTLRKAVSIIEEAVRMTETNKSDLSRYLNNLGLFLSDLASFTGDKTYWEQSISSLERGSECAPETIKSGLLLNLGNTLRTLYDVERDVELLNRAVGVYQDGLEANPTALSKPKLLNGLAASLLARCLAKTKCATDDLDDALRYAGEAVENSDDDHPFRAIFLDTYASVLFARFGRQHSIELLDASISYGFEAVGLASERCSPETPAFVVNLVESLLMRRRIDSSDSYLDSALEILENVLQDIDDNHQNGNYCSLLYTRCLLDRYERDGDERDIQACSDNLAILSKVPAGKSVPWSPYLAVMVEVLIRHSEISSSAESLDQAVDILKSASLRIRDHSPEASVVYDHLSVGLLARFQLRGSLDDLTSASTAARKALELLDESSIEYTLAQVTYANALLRTYEETEEERHLNSAIQLYEQVARSNCVWRSLRPGRLTVLAFALQLRFGLHKRDEDWEECLAACKESVDASKDSPTHYIPVGQMGNAWFEKSRSNNKDPRNGEYLEQAIQYLTASLDSMPRDHTDRASWLNNLGLAYESLFKYRKDSVFYRYALDTYHQAIQLETASPFLRVTAAYRALVLAGISDLQEAVKAVKQAIDLLPTLSPRLLRREDQQHMITMFSGLGIYGAAVLLEAEQDPLEAVRVLETSRGIMNSLLIDTRTDLTVLEEQDETLALEFKGISSKLDTVSEFPSRLAKPDAFLSRDPEARIATAKTFNKLVLRIRNIHGLEDFLMPPTGKQIRSVAGPSCIIFVNVATFRSDALIVQSDRIWNISLTNLKSEDAISNANKLSQAILDDGDGTIDRIETNECLREILAWLWRSLVNPILTALPQEKGEMPKRICWIPAGVMTNFPIHAASDPEGHNAMDTIVSTYGTTIKGLRHSQQKLSSLTPGRGCGLLVGMQLTPGERDLQFAQDEVSSVESLLRSILPATTVLRNPPGPGTIASTPTKHAVLSLLSDAEVLHLSCHGLADAENPSQSRLLLADWQSSNPGPLTVADIAAQRLPNARLAFLSACHAAIGRAPDLIDEGIHLAGAFQLAGFPQVVGTLWQVSDKRAMQLSKKVWQMILASSDGEGSQSIEYQRLPDVMNKALRELRQDTKMADDEDDVDLEFEDEPFVWAPFVYMGL
ncbi:CHAT domain-containing protein [Dactylonectria macrodidyma]|uniref:CHAT domain-containing protein n=1 Tax=Dactylonectria macrodidyma TaxID=307937 RepID=A0A9P9DME4_9HYPO|nr:CHAT domain-containing protein [Dactylonectria macrodidyma]